MISALRDAVLADPSGTLLALDFDGTLAPIVDDPARAHVHPAAVAALDRLGPKLGAIAIVTGRPVAQVLELGGFLGRQGLSGLLVRGQYGVERLDGLGGQIHSPEPPAAVREVADLLPQWLIDHGAAGARIEDKSLAVAVHTRGLGAGVFDALAGPLGELAVQYGLVLEPGREVLELRSASTDKGDQVRELVASLGSRVVVFAGDDLGDLPAFEAVESFPCGFTVFSSSEERKALSARADLVLDGPEAVAAWLNDLADVLT